MSEGQKEQTTTAGAQGGETRDGGTEGSLTFDALRRANLQRLPLFKNPHGEPAHSEPDGSDWSLGEWCNAVLGELGEAANLIKKVHRGDLTLDEARPELAREYADVVTYLDLLAYRTGVDLGAATVAKWNRVSERIGVPLRLALSRREDETGDDAVADMAEVNAGEPLNAAESILRKWFGMYDWTPAEARVINDFILTVREGVQEDIDALRAALDQSAREEGAAHA